ncbi:MAG: hypothetical protein EB096_10680, partial [Betaproteobacteria bacterium]|nr:hypothetical protein [Betaproteobacteria bacterium]
DTSTDHPILGADGKPRNVVNKVITAKDVGAGTVDITLGDLGTDGEYRLVVSQQDAAGNASTPESRNYLAYTLDTLAPLAPDLSNVTNGAINFGPQTPLGLVNAATKQAGFVLKGSGEAGCMVSLAWGNTLLTTLVNQHGEWSLSIDDSKVPADNTNSQLTLTQADVAGNVSKAKTYKVEIATAGVTAQVVSIVVSDDNAETAAGAYSGNASGVMTAGMSTDDNTPVVTVKLDRPLYNNEVIEVYDGTRNAQSTPLFTLSGDYASIQDKLYAWTFNTSNWPTTKALSAGTHRLTARVVNTYTLDVGADTDTERAGPTFVVQTLDFNQLLVPTGDGELTNLIQPGKSAGAESIASTPSNTPKLGGTLTAALGTGERLGIYDGEQYLGDATLTPVTDRTSPHAYTWEYQITQALKNGAHDLSVRLETSTSTPLVRMAMSQDMTISLPVLTMEGTVDLNGTLVVNDTGWSSSDGYSNNRTPTLTLTLPAGYQAGDRITLMGTSSAMSPNAPPIEVASYVLTPLDLDQGFARITTNALGNTGQANRVWRLWATFENTQGGVQVSNTAPVIYELDTTQPDLPEASQMSLKNDTSKGFFTSQTGQLNAINFDVTRERLQYKIDKDGKTLQDWTDTPPGIELDVGASGRNWGDGKYTISARLVDKAGNFKPISAGSALGAGNGYINFVLDTTKPLALAAPTLQADTTN